jgi:predicted dienelactone hydrolase
VPLSIPVMIQGGSLDLTTPFSDQRRLYDLLVAPRFLVEIADAGHSNFGTWCHTPFDDCVLTATPVAELHARMLSPARGFLGRYVARDLRWETLLVSAPGAALESER